MRQSVDLTPLRTPHSVRQSLSTPHSLACLAIRPIAPSIARVQPEAWNLNFAVIREGRAIGIRIFLLMSLQAALQQPLLGSELPWVNGRSFFELKNTPSLNTIPD
jgi:hypothetical protein